MNLLPRFSLWTLLWLAVLIGASMGLYAKREPWRQMWRLEAPELKGQLTKSWGPVSSLAVYDQPLDGFHTNIAVVDLIHGTFSARSDERRPSTDTLVGVSRTGIALIARVLTDKSLVRFFVTKPDRTQVSLEALQADGALGCISEDGCYAAIDGRTELKIYSTQDGRLLKCWDRTNNTIRFFDAKRFALPEDSFVSFHPTEPRVLVRVDRKGYLEWDLEKNALTREWPDIIGKTYAEGKRYTFSYLKNGNILRRWYGDDLREVACLSPDGKERWRLGSKAYYSGSEGLFEVDFVQIYEKGVGGEGKVMRSMDKSLVPALEGNPIFLIFPDGKRAIRRHVNIFTGEHDEIVDLNSGQQLYARSDWDLSSMPYDPVIRILNDDLLVVYNNKSNFRALLKRVRPEGNWGWLYVPESYVAALAVICLFISLFKRLRAKKVSAA